MKMLMHVTFPNEPFNTLVKKGTAAIVLDEIMEEIKPFSIWFTEDNGMRGAVLIVNVTNASGIPFYSEPFYLNFDADVHFRIVMSPEDLKNSGLEALGKEVELTPHTTLHSGALPVSPDSFGPHPREWGPKQKYT